MKKIANEDALVKEAIKIGAIYAEKRGAAVFSPNDSANLKVEFIYRLLVHDKVIQPLAKSEVSQQGMRHKLAFWVKKHLPDNHPLLNHKL